MLRKNETEMLKDTQERREASEALGATAEKILQVKQWRFFHKVIKRIKVYFQLKGAFEGK